MSELLCRLGDLAPQVIIYPAVIGTQQAAQQPALQPSKLASTAHLAAPKERRRRSVVVVQGGVGTPAGTATLWWCLRRYEGEGRVAEREGRGRGGARERKR